MEQLNLFNSLSPIPLTPANQPFVDLIGESWYRKIGQVFTTPVFGRLATRVAKRREVTTVYPENEVVFRVYRDVPFEEVKVFILAQDPYPDENADGLAFSCLKSMSSTLRVIKQEFINEYGTEGFHTTWQDNQPVPLDYWAKQGVFLLNSSLTVDAGNSNSHQGFGWECVVNPTIAELVKDQVPKVFLLWGSHARKLFWSVDVPDACLRPHLVLEAAHPVVESRKLNQTGLEKHHFYGLDHFKKCNQFLTVNGRGEIRW